MTTYVLVHGAYHGGWCWRRVAARLRREGHEVFTPTLTGLGERAHLLDESVGLGTMIDDITGLVECEELEDVVLVGHSFGAIPLLGSLDVIAERVRRAVILDGIVVEPGSSGFSGVSADVVEARRRAAHEHTGGLAIPAPPPQFFGVSAPADVAWLERRLTPHPFRAYTDTLDVAAPLGARRRVDYLRCTAPVFESLAASAVLAARNGWSVVDLPATHDAMITHPDVLCSALLDGGEA